MFFGRILELMSDLRQVGSSRNQTLSQTIYRIVEKLNRSRCFGKWLGAESS